MMFFVIQTLVVANLLVSPSLNLVAAPEAASLSLDTLTLDGWAPAGATEIFLGEKLYDAIDGFADYHFGFDFKEAQRRFFTQEKKKIEVFVYRFGSPAESFGLYSVMRPRWGQAVPVGDDGVCETGNVCTAWRGPWYIAVATQGEEPASVEDLQAAARAVSQQIPGEFKRPPLVEILPKEHLEPLSVLYFHCLQPLDRVFYMGEGNLLQLAEKPTDPHEVEALYAEYDQNGRPAIVVVARYPTPEKAQKARDLYNAQLNATEYSMAEDRLWEDPAVEGFGRDYQARTGLHTLLFQRERWLLMAAEVVDSQALKTVLAKVDQELWKQHLERLDHEGAKKSEDAKGEDTKGEDAKG